MSPVANARSLASLLAEYDPRIALVGPKGGGKTTYRMFLAEGELLPAPIRRALGVRFRGSLRAGTTIEYSQEKGWHRGRETLPSPHPDAWAHLPRVPGTNWLTAHPMPMPGAADPEALGGHLLDFPGEFVTTPQSADLEPVFDAVVRDGMDAIARCRLVVLLVPFWLLLSRAHRQHPPAHMVAIGAQLGLSRAAVAAQRAGQWQSLEKTGRGWLNRLETELVGRPPKQRPLILVVLNQFGADWRFELSRQLGADDPLGCGLARVRSLLESGPPPARGPLLTGLGEANLLRRLRTELNMVRDASRLRSLLYDLDAEISEVVDLSAGHGSALGKALYSLRLSGLETRYTAMNLVSERSLLRPRNPGEGQPPVHLALELAGEHNPMTYMCGCVDDLR